MSRFAKTEDILISSGSDGHPPVLHGGDAYVPGGPGNGGSGLSHDAYGLDGIAGSSDLFFTSGNPPRLYKVLKVAADILIAAAGMILLSPLFLVIALAIKWDSGGRVFYRQKRCGVNGTVFKMIKFRTMVEDAEKLHQVLIPKKNTDGPVFKMINDPRVTDLGRFLRRASLDELPQLFNVLRGEMSLVGPRPLAMEEMTENDNWRLTRLTVKPGMTGLWQIKARGSNLFSDWVKYDTEYVCNRSLLLDMRILLMTIPAVLRRNGAH